MRCNKRLAAALTLALLFSSRVHAAPDSLLIYKKKYVMGTVFEIAAYDCSYENASAAIDKAFQTISRLDDLLSNYKTDSALNALNRSAHFREQRVPPDLYVAIAQALQFSTISSGKFDISVGPLVDLWKAALNGGQIPSESVREQVRNCIGYRKIQLIPPDRISLHSPCMRLDLGAIGKGYAVDRAAEILRAAGLADWLINAGGSTLAAAGAPPGEAAWLVRLRDPSHRINPYVLLTDASVSTSEQSMQSLLGKSSAGHIIDPDTEMPVPSEFAVSVVARTGTISDALSTTLLLLGPKKAEALTHDFGEFSAIWISPSGNISLQGTQIHLSKEP